ncbi:hypothetical protein FUAX_41930 (plasmid) [Fulvitalea axinellae]|uniref:SMODS and SLOG-associating 2TM effector domain-containing protein n=1 Tax=Fulvitalea axinellae TaxID=1182444 RepID=A0AAU9CRI4_9BACT|nr:hypothetical protein FUAX_41930 [Fulvitalea axinellae]
MKNTPHLFEKIWNADRLPEHEKDYIFETYRELMDRWRKELDWYYKRSRTHRLKTKAVKNLAVILVGLAVLSPLLSDVAEHLGVTIATPEKGMGYTLGYVCFAFASAALLFDNVFGFSKGWIRYMTAKQKLDAELMRMRHRIQQKMVDTSVAPERLVQELLDIFHDTDHRNQQILMEETTQWSADMIKDYEHLKQAVAKRGK